MLAGTQRHSARRAWLRQLLRPLKTHIHTRRFHMQGTTHAIGTTILAAVALVGALWLWRLRRGPAKTEEPAFAELSASTAGQSRLPLLPLDSSDVGGAGTVLHSRPAGQTRVVLCFAVTGMAHQLGTRQKAGTLGRNYRIW